MIESTVKISMKDENDLNCSYAIISKDNISVIIILKELECAIFDYNNLKSKKYNYHYLLLKHYNNTSYAYMDFLKLIGKMCKKNKDSKYFFNHKSEDNRMVFDNFDCEHMIKDEEKVIYKERFSEFEKFVLYNKNRF